MASSLQETGAAPSEFGAGPCSQDGPQNRWVTEPSLRETLSVVLVTTLVFVPVLILLRSRVTTVPGFGDNGTLLTIASAIRHWDFHALVFKAFWGLPYAIAAVSLVTRVSGFTALLLVSCAAGWATVVLAYRLWGGWIASFFAVINFDWMQRLFLGGSETLFTTLLFGSFLAARRQRWILAALLAALSTIVRPVGIFALLAIGIALLRKRDFGNLALATLVGMIVGGLYVLPLVLYFHNPLANVQMYQTHDWQGGQLFSWPLHAILESTARDHAPLTNLLLTWGWILFVSAGFVALVLTKRCRQYWRTFPVEAIFAVGYLFFLYTYNSPEWARGNFPRFAIPVIPIVLMALSEWLPKDRRLVWCLALLSPALAACSAIGVKNVAEVVRRTIL